MPYKIHPMIELLAKRFKIKLIPIDDLPTKGEWRYGKKIYYNPNKANHYVMLHEIAHVICGYGCCREHCEFEAHGGAKVLMKLLDLRFSKKDEDVMDCYAGRSSHEACGRIEIIKRKQRKKKDFWDKFFYL